MKRVLAVSAAMVLGLSACGGSKGSNGAPSTDKVKSDLSQLLENHSTPGSVQFCAHQTGNEFVCQVSGTKDGTVSVTVTDDGTTIFEQGL